MSHATVAVSERAVRQLFNVLRDRFTFSSAQCRDFGAFTACYDLAFHLEGGTIDLRNDNTIQIKELDIKWDRMAFSLGIDLPELCVGGFCIIPNPFDDCILEAPRICVFSADPDITIPLDLSGLLTSEVSVTASPIVKYRVDPARTPSMSDLDAEDANIPNKWQLFIDPVTIDVDPIDVSDTIGDLLERAARAVIDNLLGFLPDWARDLLWAIIGPVIDLLRWILDIPDDIGEWLSDLLGVSFGLLNLIATFIADNFADKTPLYELEDPFPVMDAVSTIPLNPVKIPIRDLSVRVNTAEMLLEANIGG
jgi:hypothetical protein